jgi:hypothetical protein
MPCYGPLIRAHLIPRQQIRRASRSLGNQKDGSVERALINDPRSFVMACGGLSGLGGHHGELDMLRLSPPRSSLPHGTEELATELGLEWLLDRMYGPRP